MIYKEFLISVFISILQKHKYIHNYACTYIRMYVYTFTYICMHAQVLDTSCLSKQNICGMYYEKSYCCCKKLHHSYVKLHSGSYTPFRLKLACGWIFKRFLVNHFSTEVFIGSIFRCYYLLILLIVKHIILCTK